MIFSGMKNPACPGASTNWRRSYQAQGRYAEAEPLYKRSLAIVARFQTGRIP